MENLRLALLVLHLLGFAALFGGLLVQLGDTERKVNLAMRGGAGAALTAGILLWRCSRQATRRSIRPRQQSSSASV
jgi:hypothetical protein